MSGLKKVGPSRKAPKQRSRLDDAAPSRFERGAARPFGARVPDDFADYFSWDESRPSDRSRHVRG